MSNLFWLTGAQMARLEPDFPWQARVDDRRVLSGIIFINRNGLRWHEKGVFTDVHRALASGSR